MDMPRLESACEPAEHCQEADTQDDIQEVVGTHFCVGGASKAKVLIPELLLLLLQRKKAKFMCEPKCIAAAQGRGARQILKACH